MENGWYPECDVVCVTTAQLHSPFTKYYTMFDQKHSQRILSVQCTVEALLTHSSDNPYSLISHTFFLLRT